MNSQTEIVYQPYTPGASYVWNGQEIPSQQTLAPATAPHLAFRPSCEQLQIVEQDNGFTAFLVHDPYSDSNVVISEQPSTLPLQDAIFYAASDGACKIGGVTVDIVPISALPKRITPEVQAATAAVVNAASSDFQVGVPAYIGGVFIVLGVAITTFCIWRKPVKKIGVQGDGAGADNKPSIFETLVTMAADTEKENQGEMIVVLSSV